MALSKHIPNYRRFDLFHGDLLKKKSQEQNENGSSKTLKGIFFRKLDVWSAAFSDLTAHEHYDVVIVGSDILLNLIAAQKMHQGGKKVLIDYRPTFNESENAWQNLQKHRNEMFSYSLSLVIAHYSEVNPASKIEDILGELSSTEAYGHSNVTDIPVLNLEYSFQYCSELTQGIPYGYQCHEIENAYKDYTKKLRTNLPVLKLLDVPEDGAKGCLPRYLLSCDRIIITSEDCHIKPTVLDEKIVRIGSAVRSTKEFVDFTVSDRLDDFEDAYAILSKI